MQKQLTGRKTLFFNKLVFDQLDFHKKKIFKIFDQSIYKKINSEWITDLNTKYKATKLLEENERSLKPRTNQIVLKLYLKNIIHKRKTKN